MTKKRRGETSYKETIFGIIPRSQLIPLEIEGIKRAWDFVLKQKNKKRIHITSHFLQKIHAIGFGWIFPKIGGVFRTIEVTVSSHTPPRAYEIGQLMLDFTADLKIRLKHLPPLKNEHALGKLIHLLAWAHHRFLWIHPFADYNGRMGRLLVNIILLKLDLPPIELKVETETGRSNYIMALQQADLGHFNPLEKLMRQAIEEAVKKFQ